MIPLRLRPLVGLALVLPLLVGCENTAVSYSIDGNREAVILVREQPWFWSSEVNQAVIVSRLPACQRRVSIKPGSTQSLKMEVFVAGDRLWALREGPQWYLASTEQCLVQDWNDAPATPPGKAVGTFLYKDGTVVFEGAEAPAR